MNDQTPKAAPVDHRAEAERLLAAAVPGRGYSADAEVIGIQLTLARAQVHATLAAGTPVADQHVREALAVEREHSDRLVAQVLELQTGPANDLIELCAAVRDALDSASVHNRDALIVDRGKFSALVRLAGVAPKVDL